MEHEAQPPSRVPTEMGTGPFLPWQKDSQEWPRKHSHAHEEAGLGCGQNSNWKQVPSLFLPWHRFVLLCCVLSEVAQGSSPSRRTRGQKQMDPNVKAEPLSPPGLPGAGQGRGTPCWASGRLQVKSTTGVCLPGEGGRSQGSTGTPALDYYSPCSGDRKPCEELRPTGDDR